MLASEINSVLITLNNLEEFNNLKKKTFHFSTVSHLELNITLVICWPTLPQDYPMNGLCWPQTPILYGAKVLNAALFYFDNIFVRTNALGQLVRLNKLVLI